MKKCIWCHREESETTFKKLSHKILQSLKGIASYCNGIAMISNINCNDYCWKNH